MDWQIASNTRLSGRWVHNFDDQQFAYGTTTASWNFPLTVTDRKNGPGNTLSFTLTHIFSPTLVNEFIYGAGRGGVDIAPSDDKATRSVTGINTPLLFPDANAANLIPSLTFGGIASITTGANGGPVNTSVFGPFNQRFVIDNFIDNLTKSAGKHTLKAGLYYQRASNASNSQTNVQSNIDFTATGTNPLNTGYPFANALLGVYTSYTQASAKPDGKYAYYDLSGYIQDTYKPNSKTTLDLGLRLSHYDPYYNASGPGAYFNPALYNAAKAPRLYRGVCVALPCTNNNLRAIDPATPGSPTVGNTVGSFFIGKLVPNSGDLTNGMGLTSEGYLQGGINGQAILPQPRLGFAWDPSGDHRTVVRGGFGLSFDRYESGAGVGSGATNQPYVFNPTLVNGYLQDLAPGLRRRPRAAGGGRRRSRREVARRLQLQRRRAARSRPRRNGRHRLRRYAVAPQSSPREPQRAAVRHDVPGVGAGSDALRDRRRARPSRPGCRRCTRPPVCRSPVSSRCRPTSSGRIKATATSPTTISTAARRSTRCRCRCSGASRAGSASAPRIRSRARRPRSPTMRRSRTTETRKRSTRGWRPSIARTTS